ncbi:MAG: hypothetical protein AB1Y25_02795 [Cycloclasticus sp.]
MNMFPTKHEKLITIIIFSFITGLVLGLITKVDAKEIFIGLITLSAAFMGAYSAFALQNRKHERERTTAKVEAGNKAIFNLVRSYNTFLAFKKQFIDPFENDPGKFVSIPPSIGFEGKANFDFDSLTYLFQIGDPNILGELSSFQAEVEATIALILQRSHMHLNGVQPAMEKSGVVDGQDIYSNQLKEILGNRLFVIMVQGTDQMIEGVNSIILNAEKLIEKLHKIHIKNYKGHIILKMQKLNNSN